MAPPMLSSSMFMWKVSRWILQLGRPTRSAKAIPSAAVFMMNCSKRLTTSTQKRTPQSSAALIASRTPSTARSVRTCLSSPGNSLRGQDHTVGYADSVSEAEARIRGGAFERVPLRIAHAGDFRRVDLKNIEAIFLGSFDKLDGLRVPVLGPVSEVYSDGVHVSPV